MGDSDGREPLSTRACVAFAHPGIGCDLRELVEGCLQVLDNFGCQDGGVGQFGRMTESVVPEPEDIEIDLVALIKST